MVSLIVILLRFVWVFPGAQVSKKMQQVFFGIQPALIDQRHVFIVAWGGMRGVIALAAALSLPETLRDGTTPFPARNIIIFFTFCVILVTLVFQGLTLPVIIRKLGLAQNAPVDLEEQLAREKMIDNAIAYLVQEKQKTPAEREVYDALEKGYRRRLALMRNPKEDAKEDVSMQARRFLDVARAARNVERHTAGELLATNQINDIVYQQLILDIDLQDARFAAPYSS
jgi:CPA1 family monovalent cation:H+ antiporter